MEREDSLNTNAIADLSDNEGSADTCVVLCNDDTFEYLDSLGCAFNDLEEYFDCVTYREVLCIFLELLCFNSLNYVHFYWFPYYPTVL